MIYFDEPKRFKCIKCGHVDIRTIKIKHFPERFCPYCFNEWLKNNIPIMEEEPK